MSRENVVVSPPGRNAEKINRAARDFIGVVSQNITGDVFANYPGSLAANAVAGVLFAISQNVTLTEADAEAATDIAVGVLKRAGALPPQTVVLPPKAAEA